MLTITQAYDEDVDFFDLETSNHATHFNSNTRNFVSLDTSLTETTLILERSDYGSLEAEEQASGEDVRHEPEKRTFRTLVFWTDFYSAKSTS